MKHKAQQFNLQLNDPRCYPMRTDLKRTPTFEDTDRLWFGKYGPNGTNEPLSDIPASYFRWLWTEAGYKTYSGKELNTHSQIPLELYNKIKLANYIWNSQSAIAEELGEEFP